MKVKSVHAEMSPFQLRKLTKPVKLFDNCKTIYASSQTGFLMKRILSLCVFVFLFYFMAFLYDFYCASVAVTLPPCSIVFICNNRWCS